VSHKVAIRLSVDKCGPSVHTTRRDTA